ncbi:MAG: dihydrolipoamide acetyltransferase, partial [Burkholderiaceae bacterium]|nr:dihydrolipoamide acetyltransferase [Burkholderiaceae bacterium]
MALVNILVPDIGDFSEVGVIELLVKAGDTVKVEQSLITVESDKASMEIPSSHAGVVKELKVALGDKVSQGSVIAVLDSAEAAASEEKPAPAPANQAPAATKPEAAAPAVAPAASGPIEVRVPDIGDFKDVAVIELLVKPGDTIAPEQSLFTVESDKASMEIPSPAAGVLKELKVQLGDKVNQGDLVAIIEGAAAGAAAPAPAAPAPAPAAAAPTPAASPAPTPAPAASVAAPAH